MEVATQSQNITLKSNQVTTRFDYMGINWRMAYVDFGFCFNRKVFLYNSNLIAN